MRPDFVTDEKLVQFIDLALKEDIGDGDHSSISSIPEESMGTAELLIKESGLIAGIEVANAIFKRFDSSLEIIKNFQDSDTVKPGDIGIAVKGKVRSILSTERLALNCLQRMSGIATYTASLVEMIKGTKVKILDTRKTTPNFRMLEKWAVSIGGGKNHRFGLYDMIMLKDNHIDYAGGITKAISDCKDYLKENNKNLRIEIETRNIEEVKEAIDIDGIDVIMLDNMMPSEMTEAVELIDGKAKVEASGGINESNLREVAETGVDYISIGALTHSAQSLDMSLKASFFSKTM